MRMTLSAIRGFLLDLERESLFPDDGLEKDGDRAGKGESQVFEHLAGFLFELGFYPHGRGGYARHTRLLVLCFDVLTVHRMHDVMRLFASTPCTAASYAGSRDGGCGTGRCRAGGQAIGRRRSRRTHR